MIHRDICFAPTKNNDNDSTILCVDQGIGAHLPRFLDAHRRREPIIGLSIDYGTSYKTNDYNLHQHAFPYEVMLATRVGEGVQKPRSNGHVITITVQTQPLQLCLRLDIRCAYCTTLVYDFIDCILSAVGQPTGRVSPTYSV